MDDIPLSALLLTLVVLLAMSAFFSLSETAMMASNRFRLRHLAQSGHHGAQKALALLERTGCRLRYKATCPSCYTEYQKDILKESEDL